MAGDGEASCLRRVFVDTFVGLLGLLSFLYVLNISVGVVEFLPDNLPVVGNLDEATATVLLLACLNYFGISGGRLVNLLRLIGGKPPLVQSSGGRLPRLPVSAEPGPDDGRHAPSPDAGGDRERHGAGERGGR